MKAILIDDCHLCKPKKWEIERESGGVYFCKNCHHLVRVVLKLKKGAKRYDKMVF